MKHVKEIVEEKLLTTADSYDVTSHRTTFWREFFVNLLKINNSNHPGKLWKVCLLLLKKILIFFSIQFSWYPCQKSSYRLAIKCQFGWFCGFFASIVRSIEKWNLDSESSFQNDVGAIFVFAKSVPCFVLAYRSIPSWTNSTRNRHICKSDFLINLFIYSLKGGKDF